MLTDFYNMDDDKIDCDMRKENNDNETEFHRKVIDKLAENVEKCVAFQADKNTEDFYKVLLPVKLHRRLASFRKLTVHLPTADNHSPFSASYS